MTSPADPPLLFHPEVAEALADGRPVVALESTIISHGLPADRGLEVATRIEDAVRAAGAVPATIALIEGSVRVGLEAEQLKALVDRDDVAKASIRDVAVVLAQGGLGATTVASTSWIASLAGIRTFATGGLGGVHREASASWDESADLYGMAVSPVTVVCAGAKSILDVAATLERLESLSVTVVGYQADRFPGFYVRDTAHAVPWRVDSPAEIAAVMGIRERLGVRQAMVVANPIAEASQLDPAWHDEVLQAGLAELDRRGVRGKDVTPFLLAYFHERTGGASLQANIDLVLGNARLAGAIASEYALLRQ